MKAFKLIDYSQNCLARPLKNIDKTKILMTNGSLLKVVLQNAPHGAFCNTFDLH